MQIPDAFSMGQVPPVSDDLAELARSIARMRSHAALSDRRIAAPFSRIGAPADFREENHVAPKPAFPEALPPWRELVKLSDRLMLLQKEAAKDNAEEAPAPIRASDPLGEPDPYY